ncbi:MAG: BfmA/BtgA family mobilization protein [Flavobacterium sp.]
MKTQNLTTISLSVPDNQRLSEYCKTYSIRKKDFIFNILNYLETNGINIKIHNAPKTELEKIVKRIDQLFAFIKMQEKTFFRPALNSVTSSEFALKSSINNLVKRSDLSRYSTQEFDVKIAKELNSLNQELTENLLLKLNQMDKDLKDFQDSIRKEREENKTKGIFNFSK